MPTCHLDLVDFFNTRPFRGQNDAGREHGMAAHVGLISVAQIPQACTLTRISPG